MSRKLWIAKTPKKSRRGRPRKTKIPAPEESAQETSPEHSASDNSALGADKKKSGTGKTAAPAVEKRQNPAGAKPIPFKQ